MLRGRKGIDMIVFAAYFIIINICGLAVIGIDKYRASRKKRRIPERALLTAGFLGGSLGIWIGMRLFRHKTHKPRFYIGIPVMLLLQAVLCILIFTHIRESYGRPSAVVSRQLQSMKDPSDDMIRSFASDAFPSVLISDGDVDESAQEAIRLFFRNYDYSIISEKIDADKSSAFVTADITNIDTHQLANDLCTELTKRSAHISPEGTSPLSLQDYFDMLRSALETHSYELRTTTAEFHLSRSEDGWRIISDDELQNSLVSGFNTWINDPYLLNPDDVLSIYLDEFASLTPDEWLWYLDTDDIFATYSANYAAELDRLYTEKIAGCFSYQIDGCRVNGDTAETDVSITSVDMRSVLRLYRSKLLAYAESSESITDDDAALSDAKAVYLMEALRETDAVSTQKITVMMINDGKTWQPQISSDLANAFLGNIQGGLEVFNSSDAEN